jgi:hypothetical protein
MMLQVAPPFRPFLAKGGHWRPMVKPVFTPTRDKRCYSDMQAQRSMRNLLFDVERAPAFAFGWRSGLPLRSPCRPLICHSEPLGSAQRREQRGICFFTPQERL